MTKRGLPHEREQPLPELGLGNGRVVGFVSNFRAGGGDAGCIEREVYIKRSLLGIGVGVGCYLGWGGG